MLAKVRSTHVIVRSILNVYNQLDEKSASSTESCVLFDESHDHYLLVLMGWDKDERIKSVMIHIRLEDGKTQRWQKS